MLSDHAGWWQPWYLDTLIGDGLWHSGQSAELDHANAPWQLGECHHCPLANGGWARVQYRNGSGELWLLSPEGGDAFRVARDYSDFRYLRASGGSL